MVSKHKKAVLIKLKNKIIILKKDNSLPKSLLSILNKDSIILKKDNYSTKIKLEKLSI